MVVESDGANFPWMQLLSQELLHAVCFGLLCEWVHHLPDDVNELSLIILKICSFGLADSFYAIL